MSEPTRSSPANRDPACILAAGTQTAPGGELSLKAACNWVAESFGADATVFTPRTLRLTTLPAGPRYVEVGRARALASELLGLATRGTLYVGLADRLPLVSRATQSVMVVQNANVYAAHGRDVPRRMRAKYRVQRWWAAVSYHRADHVVVSTAAVAALVRSALRTSGEKIRIVPIPPVETPPPRLSQPARIGTVLLFGEVRPNKRFTWALGEISQWASTCQGTVRVVHVGSVPPTEYGHGFRSEAAGLKGAQCELRGPLRHDQAMASLEEADLLVFPSTLESHGLPLSEAMASGIPVVCSDIPAFREVGGASPMYFSGADGSLANALAAVETAEVREGMAARGATLVPLDGKWRLDAGAGEVGASPPAT